MVRTVKSKEVIKSIKAIFFILLVVMSFSFLAIAGNFGTSGQANLNISDEVESQSTHYTKCLGPDSNYCSRKSKSSYNLYDVIFYSNFTNTTNTVINASNGDGNCMIRFNESGSFSSFINMTFNLSNQRFEYNGTFGNKGILYYQINCTSAFGNITLLDNFTLLNTPPQIYSAGGFVDFNIDEIQNDFLTCTEDTLCTYNFSLNVTEDDLNDVLTFSYVQNSNTTLTNFTLNSSTGMIIINITRNINAGQGKSVQLGVTDDAFASSGATLNVNINAVNDAPYFLNLNNSNMTWAQGAFNYLIMVADEENDKPYSFNISFLNCTVAEWSTRNCSTLAGRMLFNTSQYVFNGTDGFINISFDPDRNDVGNYTINFTVRDYNNSVTPYNASFSQVVNFEVINVNSPPNVTYNCNNENSTQEDSWFSCRINVSDIDETKNLTITVDNIGSASVDFFRFNNSLTTITQSVNITTGYNTSFLANFTTDDTDVGNWLIRFTITDTSSATNLSYINFSVRNINDSVNLIDASVPGVIYTSSIMQNYYINASDDDLLIPATQKAETYTESHTFNSNTSWFVYNTSGFNQGENFSTARFSIYPAIAGIGYHYVNISVSDANNYSRDSYILFLNITNNTAPVWGSVNTTYHLIEDNNFYINLSASVSDIDLDTIIFNYTINNLNTTSFVSFVNGFNATFGIINMTLIDTDVGYHNVTINAIDVGKNSYSPLTFYFYVNNTHDNPYLKYFSCNSGCTPLGNIAGRLNITQGDSASLDLSVQDNDFKINTSQKLAFYNENLSVTLNISGPNRNLLSFTFTGLFNGNESIFGSVFSPNQSDIGYYNITINVSDASNRSSFIAFNLSILENQEPPIIGDIPNFNFSIYQNFSYDVYSNDSEDIDDSSGNLTYVINNLSAGGDFLSINRTSGVIVNSSSLILKGGIWTFNVTVNDSTGRNDSTTFTLYIFDSPILLYNFSSFNMYESQNFTFNFTANHSVGTLLNYGLYINGVLRNVSQGPGNASDYYLNFTSNFTDETTCIGIANLTLNISNQFLSYTQTWNLTINHTNYPLEFYDVIGSGNPLTVSITNAQNLTMSDYFRDVDANDACYNQTIGFKENFINGTAPTVTVFNWTNATSGVVRFSSASAVTANYTITAFEYNDSSYANVTRNVTSNNFTVTITSEVVTVPDPTPSPSSGGSSGTSASNVQYKPISLRIIVPDPISSGNKERIVIPITLENDGTLNLNNISIFANVALNGNLSDAIKVSLSQNRFSLLRINESVNFTLVAEVDTEVEGLYEINIYANVSNPKYADSSKIFINVKEGSSFEEKVVFTEELIVSNPECAEIQEIIDEAKADYQNSNYEEAQRKIDIAITSCKNAISQKPSPVIREVLRRFGINDYILISIAVALSIAFLYYFYKRFMLSRAIKIEDDI